MLMALGLSLRTARWRWIAAGVSVIGVAGLACSMSRLPWVLVAAQAALLLIVFVKRGRISARQGVALAAVAVTLAICAALPFVDKIQSRMTGDFERSVSFRQQYNNAAFQMMEENNQAFGVGLNNFGLYISRVIPELNYVFSQADENSQMLQVKALPVVHNVYYFLLAETGFIGLGCFLIYFGRIAMLGVRAVRNTRGAYFAVSLGLLIGVLSLAIEEYSDYSLWLDPSYYTLGLIGCLLAAAPTLSVSQEGEL
jgi:O-antigen ligase